MNIIDWIFGLVILALVIIWMAAVSNFLRGDDIHRRMVTKEAYEYCLSQELDKQFCYERHILGK
jgi:hypothetical protein